MVDHPSGCSKTPALARVGLFWASYVLTLLLAAGLKGLAPPRLGQLVWGLASTLILVPMTWCFARWDGRLPGEAGLGMERDTAGRFIAGAGIGFASYGFTVLAVSLAAGPLHFTRSPAPALGPISVMTCTLLALSAMEELGFRGYPLRTLVRTLGAWKAQAIVAVAFGLSHVAFGWSLQAILLGAVPSALLFGAAALAFRGLAAPIGLHAALNVARWAAGETETPGFWTLTLDEAASGRVASVAPAVGVSVTLLCALALWRWKARAS